MTAPGNSLAGLVYTPGVVAGLTDDEKGVLSELWRWWTVKLRRNMIRSTYYNMHNRLKDLQIAIPPHLTDIEMVVGWPTKAVDVLARRCRLDGFSIPGVDGDPFGIGRLWRQNDMSIELPQTITSALTHSCAFLMVTKGDTTAGEPEVLITSQSALYASGLWDFRRRRLGAAMAIINMDDIGRITEWVLFLPNVTIRGMWDRRWQVDRFEHSLDRLPVEVLPYHPNLDRPFGKSRITREVMDLADAALRTLVRMEVHAEFFSSPQRYAMGADEKMFTDADGNTMSQWQAIMGRVWAAPRDPDTGEMPQLGQFNATSPQPHTDQLRALAAQFAAASDLPLNALGIVQDNPSSAQAIEAAERSLIQTARATTDNFGPRIVRAVTTAVQIRDNLDAPPPELEDLQVLWLDPEDPPQSAAGDFLIKLLQAMPWLVESRVPLEQLGWDQATIDRAFADKRRAAVSNVIANLGQLQTVPSPPTPEMMTGAGVPG